MLLRKSFFFFTFCLAIFFAASLQLKAQEKTITPDLSVVGIKLGERASAKAFLDGYQARIGEDGRPVWYFYNELGTQVLKLTGASFEDRFFITEIVVYKVDKSYKSNHFYAEKISYFKTEKNIFIGYKQSTASMITGIPNVDGKDMTGPKTVAKKIGEPTERVEKGQEETLIYKLPEIELTDESGKKTKFSYSAQYEFTDNKLERFVLNISDKK